MSAVLQRSALDVLKPILLRCVADDSDDFAATLIPEIVSQIVEVDERLDLRLPAGRVRRGKVALELLSFFPDKVSEGGKKGGFPKSKETLAAYVVDAWLATDDLEEECEFAMMFGHAGWATKEEYDAIGRALHHRLKESAPGKFAKVCRFLTQRTRCHSAVVSKFSRAFGHLAPYPTIVLAAETFGSFPENNQMEEIRLLAPMLNKQALEGRETAVAAVRLGYVFAQQRRLEAWRVELVDSNTASFVWISNSSSALGASSRLAEVTRVARVWMSGYKVPDRFKLQLNFRWKEGGSNVEHIKTVTIPE